MKSPEATRHEERYEGWREYTDKEIDYVERFDRNEMVSVRLEL